MKKARIFPDPLLFIRFTSVSVLGLFSLNISFYFPTSVLLYFCEVSMLIPGFLKLYYYFNSVTLIFDSSWLLLIGDWQKIIQLLIGKANEHKIIKKVRAAGVLCRPILTLYTQNQLLNA